MGVARLFKKTTVFIPGILFIFSACYANAGIQQKSAHYRNAEYALAKGDTDQAGTELKLALQKNPLDSKAHYLLGSLLAWQGEEDQAMVGFQRTIRIDPTHPAALHNLGTLLLKRGEAVQAAQLLEATVTNNPDYIPPYNSLGKAYFEAGLPELAMATYEEVLQRDADNFVAKKNLAMLLAAKKKSPGKSTIDLEAKPEQLEKLPKDFEKMLKESEGEPDENSSKEKKPEKSEKDAHRAKQELKAWVLRQLVEDMPYLKVEKLKVGKQDDMVILTGWTRGENERKQIDKVLAKWPNVLDMTVDDTGDPQRMLEIDALLFVVQGDKSKSVGFNFLRQIEMSYSYFNSSSSGDGSWAGVLLPNAANAVTLPSWGSLFAAAVDYDVNIANARHERVAVLARPHLTTLNGTPAYFLAGGEFVFRVSGIESGDIKPYPFGTSLTITPTLLRTPGEDGAPRIHLKIQAQRTSVLEFLSAQTSEDSIVFDKLLVNSQAILDLDQTLILSGLNQRESRVTRSGVPGLKEVPGLKYLFSQKTVIETNTAVIILLTPRDPAFVDANNRKARADYIQMRRDLVEAKRGTDEDLLQFQEHYPNWRKLPPNRFASHFFLVENSELYRSVSGEDFIDEDLDLNLLGDVMKPEKKKKQKKTESDEEQ